MARILNATCEAGVVKVGTLTVAADIQSEGVAPSSGILILDAEKSKYLAKTSGDLKETIAQVTDILSSLVSILTAIDGGLTVPGTNAGAISALSALNSTLADLGDNLK